MSSSPILVLLCLLTVTISHGRDYEGELVFYLKNNITHFSPILLPRVNRSKVVIITADTLLSQIVSVDTAKQSMTISAFLQLQWEEERLVWNPANFGDIRTLSWDTSVWFPVVMIYNGIGSNIALTPQLPVHLKHERNDMTVVTATWMREFEFACEFNMQNFPVDHHVCEIEFSFSDQGEGNFKVIPKANNYYPFDPRALYRKNGEWKLLNLSIFAEVRTKKLITGSNLDVRLPTYGIRLEIERRSTYYLMNIITPLLLLTLLQVLVYFVPLESGEKLGFGITIMLSYTVFLLLLDGILPKSQTMPAIASFITAAMILSTISLLLTSLIMRLHFAPKGTQMPGWLRAVLVRFLGRVFCVRGAGERRRTQPAPDSQASVKNVAEEEAPALSDWVVAAHAIERLMVAMGVVATVCIIGIFVVRPFVASSRSFS